MAAANLHDANVAPPGANIVPIAVANANVAVAGAAGAAGGLAGAVVVQQQQLSDDELVQSWLFDKSASTVKGYSNRVREWRFYLAGRRVALRAAKLHHAQGFANTRLKARGIIIRPTMAILKSLYRWLASNGHISKNPMANLKLGAQRPAARERKLSREEVRMLITAAGKMARNPKMYSILVKLGVYSGLRRAELAKLNTDDITKHPSGSISVLVRHGKGNKTRRVVLAPKFGAELLAYAQTLGAGVPVFSATASTIGNRIRAVAIAAG